MWLDALALRTIRSVADQALRGVSRWRFRDHDLRNTVVLASSPRGGSTWLAEILAEGPDRVMVWEPLSPAKNPQCREYGFGWQPFLSEEHRGGREEHYVRALLSGRLLSTRTMTRSEFSCSRLLRARKLIVKLVNANLLLPWITASFPVSAIHLVRHPCAVVASQLRHGAWQGVDQGNIALSPRLAAARPELVPIRASLRDRVEALAFEWAVQNSVPLEHPAPRWTVAYYEHLVLDGTHELRRIHEAVGLPLTPGAIERLDIESASVDPRLPARDPLSSWRTALSGDQVRRVLAVVRRVGVTCYGEGLLPNDEVDSCRRR